MTVGEEREMVGEERDGGGERDWGGGGGGGEGERDGGGGWGRERGMVEEERDGEGGEGKMETVRPRSVLTVSMCHKANRETFHPTKWNVLSACSVCVLCSAPNNEIISRI